MYEQGVPTLDGRGDVSTDLAFPRANGGCCIRCRKPIEVDTGGWLVLQAVIRQLDEVCEIEGEGVFTFAGGRDGDPSSVEHAAVCGGCVLPREETQPHHESACEGCGLKLHVPVDFTHRVVCSHRCSSRVKRRLRREAMRGVCQVCGREFKTTRMDALTCSPQCRQRRYRQRHA
jgi:hypothetical protein